MTLAHPVGQASMDEKGSSAPSYPWSIPDVNIFLELNYTQAIILQFVHHGSPLRILCNPSLRRTIGSIAFQEH
jgi:hypothetical protein